MNRIDNSIMKDVVQWDVANWKRAIYAWELDDIIDKKALGLGEAKGGALVAFCSIK